VHIRALLQFVITVLEQNSAAHVYDVKQVHASVGVRGLPAGDEEQGGRSAAGIIRGGLGETARVLRLRRLQPLPHPTSPVVVREEGFRTETGGLLR